VSVRRVCVRNNVYLLIINNSDNFLKKSSRFTSESRVTMKIPRSGGAEWLGGSFEHNKITKVKNRSQISDVAVIDNDVRGK
jgi:hypothetical protein